MIEIVVRLISCLDLRLCCGDDDLGEGGRRPSIGRSIIDGGEGGGDDERLVFDNI